MGERKINCPEEGKIVHRGVNEGREWNLEGRREGMGPWGRERI